MLNDNRIDFRLGNKIYMGILSTREWATVIWAFIFFVYAMVHRQIREAFWKVVKIFFGKKLRILWGIILLYVLGITLIFYHLPFWDNVYIKDIIVWFLFSGLIYCMNAVSQEADEEYIRKVLKDNLKLTAILEFIISTFTFNIWVELAIIPIITMIVMMNVSVNRILGKIAEFSKAAADNAAGGPQPKFYLVVDEINRANLATVFGELIYGLEYRNSKVSTPYEVKNNVTGDITKDIVLGKNLFILGTMNTADKSIDAIDYAIRRRFIFIDSPANRDIVMKCYQNVSGNTDENSIELLLFDAVQRIFDDSRFFNNEYQKSDVRIGHTYFLRDRKRGYEDAIIEHFIFQVIPILREYVKDGILDVTENLVPLEHVVSEIHSAGSGEEQIELLSENIMLYVKEFGNLTKSNATIDNEYIGKFLDDLRKEFGY